jgi:nucleoside-diphosphate-sugar epimerase
MRYVVTGAAGFIGSHLAEALQERGDAVVAVDSFTGCYDPALKVENAAAAGLDVVRADLVESDVGGLFADADGVFHLAGEPGVRRSWGADFARYLERNVLATQRVFEAAAAAGLRVVWASSSSVYGDAESLPTREDARPRPISPYGVTKLACEQLHYAYGRTAALDAVAVRYFTVYGPRQRPDMAFARLLSALAEGRPFEVYGDGAQSRGFTFVADAVAATLAAMERGGSGTVYNVGGGSEATLLEAIELAERIAERRVELVRGAPGRGDARRTAADTGLIERELGWRAQVPLEQGLRAQWEWVFSRVGGE